MSNGRGFHVVAILKRRRKVLRIGTNVSKTHPACGRQFPSGDIAHHMHAEMNVLRFARPGDDLEVMRFRKDGTPAMAKPCMYCMKQIRENGIRRIRWTNSEGIWESMRV